METTRKLLKTVLLTQVEILGRLDRLEQLSAKNSDSECIDHVDSYAGAYDAPRADALNTLVESLDHDGLDDILPLLEKLQGQANRYN
ncbi:hypothetical protein [Modicisalibacter ilicicola]|nr:hypothetical protein [Halomonas ilicicola]